MVPPIQRRAAAAITPSGVPPTPNQHIDVRFRPGGHQRPGHIPIVDQADARSAGTHLFDKSFVCLGRSRITTVRSSVFSPLALAMRFQVILTGASISMTSRAIGSDRDLVHIDERSRVEHGSARRKRHHRDGVCQPVGHAGGCHRSDPRRYPPPADRRCPAFRH